MRRYVNRYLRMVKVIMGIIPYVDASIATLVVRKDRDDVKFQDVPTGLGKNNKRSIDGQALLEIIINNAPDLICIETVDNNNPDERENFGIAKGILDGCGIETVYVDKDKIIAGKVANVPQVHSPKLQNALNIAVHGTYVARAVHNTFGDMSEVPPQ